MLDNPDLIASLIGFDGLLAIAVTAVLTRLFADSDRAKKLETAKDKSLEKITKLEAAVDYLQEKVAGGIGIISDGRVTPGEVTQAKAGYEDIKEKIQGIVGKGGDAE